MQLVVEDLAEPVPPEVQKLAAPVQPVEADRAVLVQRVGPGLAELMPPAELRLAAR